MFGKKQQPLTTKSKRWIYFDNCMINMDNVTSVIKVNGRTEIHMTSGKTFDCSEEMFDKIKLVVQTVIES